MCELFFCRMDHLSYRQLTPLEDRLSPAQRDKVRRLRVDGVRRNRLAAYLLIRALACKKLGVDNRSLIFEEEHNGKPVLASHPGFHFNLSHSGNAVVAAVADKPVGVDVELLKPAELQIARRFFIPAEVSYIEEGEAEKDRRFFTVWTRKEACMKWTGEGMAMVLSSFSVLSGRWAEMLSTFEMSGYMISCCHQGNPPEAPSAYPEKTLLADGSGLMRFTCSNTDERSLSDSIR